MTDEFALALNEFLKSTDWKDLNAVRTTAEKVADLYKHYYDIGPVDNDNKRFVQLNTLSQWCDEVFNIFDTDSASHGLIFWIDFQCTPLFEDNITSGCQQGVVAPYLIKECLASIRDNLNTADELNSIAFKTMKNLYENITPGGFAYTLQDDPDFFRDMVARESLKEVVLSFDYRLFAEHFHEGSIPLLKFFANAFAVLERSTKDNQRFEMAKCCDTIITLFKPEQKLEQTFCQIKEKYLI